MELVQGKTARSAHHRRRAVRSSGCSRSRARWRGRSPRRMPAGIIAPRPEARQHHADRRRHGQDSRFRPGQAAGPAIPASISRQSTPSAHPEGTIVGTVPYMSPEQIQGRPIDHRTDIFSLRGDPLRDVRRPATVPREIPQADVISSILRDEPESIDDARTDLPNQLGRIINRCLEKDPELRYQSAEDIETALAKIGEQMEQAEDQRGALRRRAPVRRHEPGKGPGLFLRGAGGRADQRAGASRGSAHRVAHLHLPVQGDAIRHPGDRPATRRQRRPRRQRPQVRQPGAHQRAARQRAGRLPPLVEPLRPRTEGRLRDPGRDRAEALSKPSRSPSPRRRRKRPRRRRRPTSRPTTTT